MPISVHGLREITIATLLAALLAVVAAWLGWWYAWVPIGIVWMAVLAFFRDPHRRIPGQSGVLVAPADGHVTEISHLTHDARIGGPATRISIFLSVLDVHVNRSPCTGRVVASDYHKGEFLDARHPESGARNESHTIVIQPEDGIPGPIIVRQVAGLIARRIICSAHVGDTLGRGDRIGLIKFGSRTELIVPTQTGMQISVRLDEFVRGGATILMRSVSAATPATRSPEPPVFSGAR